MAKFWAPDYYAAFACKGGACRNSCCEGWGISVSMREYFQLLGMPCSKDLRKRIDGAFHIARNADTERYATITPRYDGDCPLRTPDGLCALQKEKGETCLPTVCRLYPRSIKTDYAPECCCSASCEAVAEALITRETPLTFTEIETDYLLSEENSKPHDPRATGIWRDLRMLCIRILQDQKPPLHTRIDTLARLLFRLREYEKRKDGEGLRLAIEREQTAQTETSAFADKADDMSAGSFQMLSDLAGTFVKTSVSLSSCWPDIQAQLGESGMADAKEAYLQCCARFEKAYPHWERAFEQLLVNHAFYSRFPFSDRLETLSDEAYSMVSCYAILRFVCVMLAKDGTMESLADAAAKALRLIEHSDFDFHSAALWRKAHLCATDVLPAFLRLV